jgi:hypothetical protein
MHPRLSQRWLALARLCVFLAVLVSSVQAGVIVDYTGSAREPAVVGTVHRALDVWGFENYEVVALGESEPELALENVPAA